MRKFKSPVILSLFLGFLCHAEESNLEQESFAKRPQIVPQISILTPQEIVLKNNTFEIPYSQNVPGLFGISVGASSPLSVGDSFQFYLTGRLGFSHKDGEYTINRIEANQTEKSNVSLAWMPVSVGVKSQYAINQFPYVRPMLGAGLGAQWMYQSSTLGGLNQHFLIPLYYVTTGLSFFDKKTPEDWFGGFSFGVSYQDSFASPQKVRVTSVDLSLNIIL